MAVHRSTGLALSMNPIWVLLIAVVLIAVVVVANLAFGVGTGPSLEIVPDPAGPLGF